MSAVGSPLRVELRSSVGGAKFVDLGAQDLPLDPDLVEALVTFLAKEIAPPSTWLEVALRYLRGPGAPDKNKSGFDLFCTIAAMFSALCLPLILRSWLCTALLSGSRLCAGAWRRSRLL